MEYALKPAGDPHFGLECFNAQRAGASIVP